VENAVISRRNPFLKVGVLTLCCAVFPASEGFAQHCEANWTAAYKCLEHCGPCPTTNNRNSNSSNYDYGAAQRAQAAAAAAEAQRQRRDAELERQRIDAENKRIAEEAEKQAQFNRDKSEALGQLKGIASGDDLDSGSGLKGVGSIDSGLKDSPNSSDSSGLKTLPDVNTDPMVVDARNVPTGLPKSVEAEIPHTPSGDRVRKGFEAIQDHDWKVALAWFQDALNHDPGNAGIQRLIDLAQFTMERAKRPRPSTLPAKPAVHTSTQNQEAMATLDKEIDDQMNADLAKSLADFNRNYLPKHPGLWKPEKPTAAAPTARQATSGATPNPPPADQKADWNAFFKSIFTRTPVDRTPRSVSAVRD
jgi:hypothetical protein